MHTKLNLPANVKKKTYPRCYKVYNFASTFKYFFSTFDGKLYFVLQT